MKTSKPFFHEIPQSEVDQMIADKRHTNMLWTTSDNPNGANIQTHLKVKWVAGHSLVLEMKLVENFVKSVIVMKKNEAFGFNYIDGELKIPIIYMNRNCTFKPSENDIVFYTDMTNDEVLGIAVNLANYYYPFVDIISHRKYFLIELIFHNFIFCKNGCSGEDMDGEVLKRNSDIGLIIDEYLKRYHEKK